MVLCGAPSRRQIPAASHSGWLRLHASAPVSAECGDQQRIGRPLNRSEREALTQQINQQSIARQTLWDPLAGLTPQPRLALRRPCRRLFVRQRANWRCRQRSHMFGGWPGRGRRIGEASHPGPGQPAGALSADRTGRGWASHASMRGTWTTMLQARPRFLPRVLLSVCVLSQFALRLRSEVGLGPSVWHGIGGCWTLGESYSCFPKPCSCLLLAPRRSSPGVGVASEEQVGSRAGQPVSVPSTRSTPDVPDISAESRACQVGDSGSWGRLSAHTCNCCNSPAQTLGCTPRRLQGTIFSRSKLLRTRGQQACLLSWTSPSRRVGA